MARANGVLARLLLVAATLAFAGCSLPWQGGTGAPTPTPTTPTSDQLAPLTFGGVVRDAITNATVENVTVRLDLSQVVPCGREGIVWSSWSLDVGPGARFGPFEVPRPNSNDVAFFLHTPAPGYADRAAFIDSTRARGDIGNLTIHAVPVAPLVGTAPAGTVLGVVDAPFPQLTATDASGAWRFDGAPAANEWLAAATDVPFVVSVRAPHEVIVPAPNGTGWRLEGKLVTESGAPLAADLVAWNGTQLASVARAGDTGVFVLPLAPHAQTLRIDARTADGRYAGTLAREVQGPPAVRESIEMRALC